MTLGETIQYYRKRAGLSQEALAELAGVSRQAVSKWESDQTNPDVAYVAQMCRLLGVSSDWLLLGEESAQNAAPERCPGCQAIVSGLDQFCPNCGRNLKSGPPEGYSILLKAAFYTMPNPAADLLRLSQSGQFPPNSPLANPISYEEALDLTASAPLVLGRGLSKEQLFSAWDAIIYPNNFLFFKDSDEEDPRVLAHYPGLNPSTLISASPREPMSFGMMVLAVILGVVGAVILLMFL